MPVEHTGQAGIIPKRQLRPSVHRPPCRARDRFTCWSSEFSFLRDATNAYVLPAPAREARRRAILASVEPATLATYSSGLLRFHEFCDGQDVAEGDRMPASDFLLSAFIAHFAGQVGKSAVDNWIVGLQLWHNLHDAPWRGARGTTAAIKSIVKKAPAKSSRPWRAPVTIAHIQALRDTLVLSDAFDTAVYAAAVVAFRACCRLGELVTPAPNLFDPSRHAARPATLQRKRTTQDVVYASFRLPWSKATGTGGAEVVLTAHDKLCPLEAVEHHLAVNKDVPQDAPLFAWKTADGGWAPLTRDWFLGRCQEVWKSRGLDAAQGHGFRIGGTTDLLLRGVPPGVVALQGRWSSSAFMKYWRKVEVIIPMFVSNAAADVSLESLSVSIARFEADLV
ncbi:hypothetical protein AURDEDRAFT_63828 [Auricularia subglabra TFB-10046 SS5]|nr:hypothetical protein AURDEDRAFT_63828 [Auricularia subglabra TFB-10046 SS5]